MPDIGNIPTGAGVFQHAQQATVRASFQHIIYKTGVSFLGSASQALEIFQCCPDADTSAVQRLPNFSKARCGLLRSGTGHLNAVLCIFSKHSGIRFYKGCATNCPLDQACGCQCAHQISDSDASECSAWGTARFSADCNVPDGVQQRGSCAISRRCKAHSSERRDYGSNGPCHFRPMLCSVVDALLDPRQCRLRRIANSKQRGVQHRQNAIDDVGQIWQALGDTVCYVDPHGCQFFLCRKELIAHIDKQAVCRITCHLAYRFAGVQTNKQFFLHATAVCAGITSHKQGILERRQVAHNF